MIIFSFAECLLGRIFGEEQSDCKDKAIEIEAPPEYFHLLLVPVSSVKVWGQRGNVKSVNLVNLVNLLKTLVNAENAVEALKLVIQHDFVLYYVYFNPELKDQARTAIENVLRKSQEDFVFSN